MLQAPQLRSVSAADAQPDATPLSTTFPSSLPSVNGRAREIGRARRRRPSVRVRRRRALVALIVVATVSVTTYYTLRAEHLPSRVADIAISTTTSTVARASAPLLLITATGITVPVQGLTSGGWRVVTPCGRTTTLTTGTVLSDIDVVIDPGHGGREVGAVANGLTESRLNLQVALELQKTLANSGIHAALTRTADYRLPIAARARIINKVRPKLFVSVQHNGGPAAEHAGPGTEVYFQRASPPSKRLAGLVWEELFNRLKNSSSHWVGATDAGAIYRTGEDGKDFHGILRLTNGVPGVLSEAAYISNPSEAALLATPEFRAAEGRSVAAAIKRFLMTKDPGSGYHEPLKRAMHDAGGGGTMNNCRDPALTAATP